jgi:chromosomal replication initiator protein
MYRELKNTASPLLIDAWGKTSQLQEIADFQGDKWLCTFACPSSFNALQFEKTIVPLAKDALTKKLGRPVEFKFAIDLPRSDAIPAPQPPNAAPPTSEPAPITAPDTAPPAPTSISAPTPPAKQIKTDFGGGLFSPDTIHKTLISRSATIAKGLGLRPDFTFETFAVSGSNEMAHMAAQTVARTPGINYNPLFLWGSVGVGKTHLMQAIGNYIIHHQPETKVIYCTSEDFTNAIIRSFQTKKTFDFKDRFRGCDVLLVDDIQFIANKEKVQEEFFHTFNALVKQNRQIVLTSDRPPHEMTLLDDRIRSRFESGLKVDIQQPAFELRSAILLTKAAAAAIDLPMEFAQTIASQVDSARKLEGIVKKLQSELELKKRPLNHELINEILVEQHQSNYQHRRIHSKEVLSAVANHYSIKQKAICGTSRQKEIVIARHVAMYLLKVLLSLSYSEIGQLFSNRDHTSVMHGVNKIDTTIKKDELLAQEVAAIKTSVLGGSL